MPSSILSRGKAPWGDSDTRKMGGDAGVNGYSHSTVSSLDGGHSLNGDVEAPVAMASQLRDPKALAIDARTIQTVRGLVLDCVEQYENGHGGDRLRDTTLTKHVY